MPLHSSSWMVQIDDRILEDLRDADTELTAWELAYDLGAKTDLVRHRCERLTHAGFLHRRDRSADGKDPKYALTLWGALYLDGEVDADLRRPYPRPRPPHAVRPGWFAGFA